MKLRVLGCHGAELPGHGTCGFLINHSVLLEGGTVCSSLTLSEQRRIRYILLSHIHVDHIKSLPFLSENLVGVKGRKPITIISLPGVVAGLRRYLFNNQIWPDFTALPARNPVFRLRAIREGESIAIDGLRVQAVAVNHTLPCAGFLIRHNKSALVFSGDTYRTDKIWRLAANIGDLRAAMIETSFPNALAELAAASKHLTPALLVKEFTKIGKPGLPLYIYHVKPRYRDRIRKELRRLNIPRMTILKDGAVFRV
ncbi:MAG: 3',5'-cyclic-nucleotide phosphodiesterase [Nitrospirota bacterium]